MDILNILKAKIEENNIVNLSYFLREHSPRDRENLIRELQKDPKYKVCKIAVTGGEETGETVIERTMRKFTGMILRGNSKRVCKIFAAKKELPLSMIIQFAKEQNIVEQVFATVPTLKEK